MFFKTCVICRRRFTSLFNGSHVRLYNEAIQNVKKHATSGYSLVDDSFFVCEECARDAAAATCACCQQKSVYEFLRVNCFSSDEFDKASYDASKRHVEELEKRVSRLTHGREKFRFSGAEFICETCRQSLIVEASESTLKELNRQYKQASPQPILSFVAVEHDGEHCERCGVRVPEGADWSELLRTEYLECFSKCFPDEVYKDEPYERYKDECRAVISKYLVEGVRICPACCWQLRPTNVYDDFRFRESDKGWISETSFLSGEYEVIHRFERITLYESDVPGPSSGKMRQMCVDELRRRSLRVGANSFIGVSYVGDGWSFTSCSAVPVILERRKQLNEVASDLALPKSVIVDGSNVVRFHGGGSVKGLIRCILVLKEHDCHVLVLLDANIFYVLEQGDRQGKEMLEKLMKENPAEVKMVPAGARADDFILLCANGDGSHILSNDRYEQYVEHYPWLKEQRLHKFMFIEEHLMIPDFGINVMV